MHEPRPDAAARRSLALVVHPAQLAPTISGKLADTVAFGYDSITGQLATVRDLGGNTFQYGYDERDQLASTGVAGYTTETRQYDNDGRLSLVDQEPVDTTIHATPISTAFRLDARGLVLQAIMGGGIGDTLTALYSGLGHLIQSGDDADGLAIVPGGSGLFHFGSTETFKYDALGNMYTSSSIASEVAQNGTFSESDTAITTIADFAAGTGRLMLSQHPTSNDTAR